MPAEQRIAIIRVDCNAQNIDKCYISRVPCPIALITGLRIEVMITFGSTGLIASREYQRAEQLLIHFRDLFQRRADFLRGATGIEVVEIDVFVVKRMSEYPYYQGYPDFMAQVLQVLRNQMRPMFELMAGSEFLKDKEVVFMGESVWEDVDFDERRQAMAWR